MRPTAILNTAKSLHHPSKIMSAAIICSAPVRQSCCYAAKTATKEATVGEVPTSPTSEVAIE